MKEKILFWESFCLWYHSSKQGITWLQRDSNPQLLSSKTNIQPFSLTDILAMYCEIYHRYENHECLDQVYSIYYWHGKKIEVFSSIKKYIEGLEVSGKNSHSLTPVMCLLTGSFCHARTNNYYTFAEFYIRRTFQSKQILKFNVGVIFFLALSIILDLLLSMIQNLFQTMLSKVHMKRHYGDKCMFLYSWWRVWYSTFYK